MLWEGGVNITYHALVRGRRDNNIERRRRNNIIVITRKACNRTTDISARGLYSWAIFKTAQIKTLNWFLLKWLRTVKGVTSVAPSQRKQQMTISNQDCNQGEGGMYIECLTRPWNVASWFLSDDAMLLLLCWRREKVELYTYSTQCLLLFFCFSGTQQQQQQQKLVCRTGNPGNELRGNIHKRITSKQFYKRDVLN